ncbi:MAG: biotin--[Clostridia bacterium]|nr:biotin--[acetyl-CoA-carboxylase] ligase [Clostridia bacterium]
MFEIKYFSEVTSTNDIVKDLAKGGAPEWTVAVADAQTCGRGRMGRSFMSPKGTGLYMSILLRPRLGADKSLLITTAAACAVAKTVEKHTGKAARIKWVNDIFLGEKKVCGILTEGQVSGDKLEYAVLGIGINLEAPKGGFGELEGIATSMFNGESYDKAAIISDILERFAAYYENLEEKPHFNDYTSRDMLRGKTVKVTSAGEVLYEATVCGIDENFALVIDRDEKKESLQSGEVSIKI